jgi:hypothetical protein
MKWLGRLLTGVLIVALVGLTLYAAYRYLVPVWPAVVYYIYITLGLLIQSYGTIILLRRLKQPDQAKDILLFSLSKAGRVLSAISRLREAVASITIGLSAVFVWPVDVAKGAVFSLKRKGKDSGVYDFLINWQMQTSEHLHAAYTAAFIGAIYTLNLAGVADNSYGRAFMFTAAASVLLRHIRYAVEIVGLPVRLRRVAASPYVTFLVIVLCDLSSLVLAFTLLTTGLPPAQITLENFATTASGLFSFSELKRLLVGTQLSARQIAVAMAGLIFYLGLLRILLRFNEFARTDDDYIWLAGNNNFLGKFTTALRFLTNVKATTKEVEYEYMVSLIGVNQVEAATDRTKRVLHHFGEDPNKNRISQVLLEACAVYPIPRHIILTLIERGISEQIQDAILQNSISLLGANSDWLCASAERLITEQKGQYPLTHAALAIAEGCYAEARELLMRAVPGSELDEVVRLGMLLRASVLDPSTTEDEDLRAYDQWVQSDLRTIRDLLPALCHPWEKTIAFAQLAFARLVSTIVGHDREQEIAFLSDRIKEEVKGNPLAELAVKSIEIRLASLGNMRRAT